MFEFDKTGSKQMLPPGGKVVIGAIAFAADALFVAAARIRTEQDSGGFQRRLQLAQHARQFLARHVEQGRIGENAVEMRVGQIQAEEILLPHLACTVAACHLRQRRRPFKTDGVVSALHESLQVATGTAAEIQNRAGWRTLDMAQQRVDVLLDVMVAGALPEGFGARMVVPERALDELPQGFRFEFHA